MAFEEKIQRKRVEDVLIFLNDTENTRIISLIFLSQKFLQQNRSREYLA
jgi:hypothetical protein